MNKRITKQNTTKKIAVSAMLVAVAFLVTTLTSVFKVAGFLSLDFKDAILSMVALLYGPVYGLVSVIVVALIEFLTISTTGAYGLVMNILSSGAFVLVCGLVYRYKRSFGGAITSAVLSVLCVTAVMLVANTFITPLYFNLPRQTVINMLPTILLPFNLCKALINASLMLLVYKPFVTALRHIIYEKNSEVTTYKFTKKSLILTICAVVFLLIAIAVIASLGIEMR